MSERTRSPLGILALVGLVAAVIVAGLATTAPPGTARANASVRLDPAPAPAPADPAEVETAPVLPPARSDALAGPAAPASDDGAAAVAAVDPPANDPPRSADTDTAAAAAAERRPLGVPNGPLSVRPVDAQSSADGHWLQRLDPRSNDVTRVVGATVVVIGLLVLLRLGVGRVAGRLGGARPSGVLEILARYPVGRGQALILMKLGRRLILLHHAGATMRTVSEVTDPDEVAALLGRLEAGASGRTAGRFQSILRRHQAEHDVAAGAAEPALRLPEPGGEVIDLTRHPRGRRRRAVA